MWFVRTAVWLLIVRAEYLRPPVYGRSQLFRATKDSLPPRWLKRRDQMEQSQRVVFRKHASYHSRSVFRVKAVRSTSLPPIVFTPQADIRIDQGLQGFSSKIRYIQRDQAHFDSSITV